MLIATMPGRVVEVVYDHATGALKSFKVESSNGIAEVWRPQVWGERNAIKGLLGEDITVSLTVEL